MLTNDKLLFTVCQDYHEMEGVKLLMEKVCLILRVVYNSFIYSSFLCFYWFLNNKTIKATETNIITMTTCIQDSVVNLKLLLQIHSRVFRDEELIWYFQLFIPVAFASKLLENLKGMFPKYYMCSVICTSLKSLIKNSMLPVAKGLWIHSSMHNYFI